MAILAQRATTALQWQILTKYSASCHRFGGGVVDMAKTYVLPAKYTDDQLWAIATDSVREANRRVTGVKPALSTLLSKYILNPQGCAVYYAKLQDVLLEGFSLDVDFVSDPPIPFGSIPGKDFEALAEAVDKKLKAISK
jgi:hypothetical protein